MTEQGNAYDPYANRAPPNPLSNFEALISVVKCAIGTGALAMPNAFYNAGYINGLIGVAVICGVVLYSLHILLHGMYELERRAQIPVLTYSEAMELAMKHGPSGMHCFSRPFRYIVDFFLTLYHFGIMCVYVVFVSLSTKEVLDAHVSPLDERIYILIFTTPLILIFMIRDLKHLVPFSFIANILLLLGFCVVFYEIFRDLPSLEDKDPFQDIEKYPLFFGTVLFAIESVGVVIAIEAEMKQPQAYLGLFGILNQGICIVCLLYAFIGFFGYMRYGDEIQGSITWNMGKSVAFEVMKVMFAVAIFFTYGLQGYVAIQVIFYHFVEPHVAENHHLIVELIVRAVIVLLSVLCAIALPHLDLFLSLIGSFCLSFLGIAFPGIFDLCVKYQSGYGAFKLYIIRDIFIIIFGLVGATLGTAISITDIINMYKSGEV